MTDFSEIFEKIFSEKEKEKAREQEKTNYRIDETLRVNIEILSNLQKIFNYMSENEKNAELITALKPLLSDDLQQKADEAIKMLKIFSIIPTLKEHGILN